MKKISLLFTAIVFWVNGFCQAPNWQWANVVGEPSSESGWSIASDINGNLYVAGNFNSTSLSFGITTIYNNGINNLFVVKYDNSGNVIWAKSAGGLDADFVYNIAADNYGNCYVTGYYYSPVIQFGSFTLINAPTNQNIFVTKYGVGGNVIWAKGIGAAGGESGFSIAVDNIGSSYVTGTFSSNPTMFDSIALTWAGAGDVFIAKYDTSGNVVWATRAGGINNDTGDDIVTNTMGDVFVTGSFQSSSITFGSTTLTNSGLSNAFIVKYNSTGNVVWARSAGGINADFGTSISTDTNGNVYVAGRYNSPSVNFGSDTLINSGSNTPDIFLAKYDSSGNVLWAVNAGGTGFDYVTSIATDYNSNCYITGYYSGSYIAFGADTLTNAGIRNFFIAKYDAGGNLMWVKNTGGTGLDTGMGITVDVNSNSYITGQFDSPTISFDNMTLTQAGAGDYFIAKLGSSPAAIKEDVKNETISLYPNPATTSFTIYPEYSGQFTISEIEIYNTLGEKVYKKRLTSDVGRPTISVADLLPGVYFVAVTDDKGNKITRKFIKM